MSDSLWPCGRYSPWNSQGQDTRVGSPSLLREIFPIQGSNPGLLHCRQILYQLSHKGSPRILQWVACPFSSRSFWPRNWTRVSCTAGGFFTNWTIREALLLLLLSHFRSVWIPPQTIGSLGFQESQLVHLSLFLKSKTWPWAFYKNIIKTTHVIKKCLFF